MVQCACCVRVEFHEEEVGQSVFPLSYWVPCRLGRFGCMWMHMAHKSISLIRPTL